MFMRSGISWTRKYRRNGGVMVKVRVGTVAVTCAVVVKGRRDWWWTRRDR